jgi:hypothetical protein
MKGIKTTIILVASIFICTAQANAIVDGIEIFYSNTIITFQKEDRTLSVNVRPIMYRFDNTVTFQYINSSIRNGNYYFLFFAIQPFGRPPHGTGPCGACIMEAAIIIKADENLTRYEIESQYVTEVGHEISTSNEVVTDLAKLDGTIFHWFVEGRKLWGDRQEIRMIISVNASQLENGFVIREFTTYDALVEHWLRNTRGTVINNENNNGSFILFDYYY